MAGILDAQTETVRTYAKMRGLELVKILREEGVSAGKKLETRPQGSELVRLVKARKVQHVIALKLDRLFRSTIDALSNVEIWDKRGIALHLVDFGGQTIDTSSATGKMFLTMTAGFAEMERNLTAERTRAALRHKRDHENVYNPDSTARLRPRWGPAGRKPGGNEDCPADIQNAG